MNRPNRRQFLALQEGRSKGRSVLRPVGRSYKTLFVQLSKDERLLRLGVAQSIQAAYVRLAYLAPARRGLAIQGLAGTPDGRQLLLALRNPRPSNRALVIPIENPVDVINDVADANFGDPIRLDLGGLGISSLEYSAARGSYLLLAARHDVLRDFRLFEWAGNVNSAPVLLTHIEPADLNAEAIIVDEDGRRALVLSDDGERMVDVGALTEGKKVCRRKLAEGKLCACDNLLDAAKKSFRGRWIELPAPATRSEAAAQAPSKGGAP